MRRYITVGNEMKSYGCFVLFIAGAAFIFSIISLLKWDNWHYITMTGSESIIAGLSALITFVTAWTIWKTIDAHNTIKDFEKKTNQQFAFYAEKMVHLTKGIAGLSDAITVFSETHRVINNSEKTTRKNIGYNWGYKVFASSLRDILRADMPNCESLIDCCIDNMEACLNNAERLQTEYKKYGEFHSPISDVCNSCFDEFTKSRSSKLNHKQHVKLENLHKRRIKLMQT